MTKILLLLLLCASDAGAREGFFSPAAYTAAAETDIEAKTIAAALPVVGGFVVEAEQLYGWKEIESLRATRCGSDTARLWNREFCAALAAAACAPDGSCAARRFSSCAGVIVDGFFVTARHCATRLGEQVLRAKMIGPDGPVEIPLEKTALSGHTLPVALSLFNIPGYKGPQASLRRQDAKDGEPVFGVGFPDFSRRARKSPAYGAPWGEPRVVLGKITAADAGEEGYFLADSDAADGMDGSPLFDKKGRLLGVAAGYDPETPARFVGAAQIRFLMGELANAEKRQEAESQARRAAERLAEARELESRRNWSEAEASFRGLKAEFGKLSFDSTSYADIADASLHFISCETGRDRARRTFPRVEYLESVTLSALSDGSRDRLLHLLPCRVATPEGDIHAEELAARLLEHRISGAPPHIARREYREDGIEASLIGMTGSVVLILRRDAHGGWGLVGARFD